MREELNYQGISCGDSESNFYSKHISTNLFDLLSSSQNFVHYSRISNSHTTVVFRSANNIPVDQVKKFGVGLPPFPKKTLKLLSE
jgi:hypothetical protein